MKILHTNLRLVFSGDTVLLVSSMLTFLASLANSTQWPVISEFRFCGICTLFVSVAFAILSALEAFKQQRQKRTIAAAILFLAAAALCLSSGHIVIETGN
jgi:uncharacterized membrane protein